MKGELDKQGLQAISRHERLIRASRARSPLHGVVVDAGAHVVQGAGAVVTLAQVSEQDQPAQQAFLSRLTHSTGWPADGSLKAFPSLGPLLVIK